MPSSDLDRDRLQVSGQFDAAWGGQKFGVWDRDLRTWRDDIGWFLTYEAAAEAIAAALPGKES